MSFSEIVPAHIRRIPAYRSENPAEELERRLGVPVVQLGMNENPFGPSPKAVEAARKYMEKIAPYPDDSGYFLRQRLADHYKISMDEIIISSGSSDILAMAYSRRVCARRGSTDRYGFIRRVLPTRRYAEHARRPCTDEGPHF